MQGDRFNNGKRRLDLMPPSMVDFVKQSAMVIPEISVSDALTQVMKSNDANLKHSLKMCVASIIMEIDSFDTANDATINVVDGVCAVLESGEKKYSAFNWAKGLHFLGVMASANRHWFAMDILEQEFDEESGIDHVYHLLTNILFINYFAEDGRVDLNDMIHQRIVDAGLVP